MRTMLRSKIHRAKVTSVNLEYEGSIAMDELLLEAASILPYEMVHVLDVNNGQRFQTYAIKGERGSGTVAVNGAAARLVSLGDIVIILSYSLVTEEEALSYQPRLVHVDSENVISETSHNMVPSEERAFCQT